MTKQVYLSGPIDGLTYDEATQWRDHVGYVFNQYSEIACHDPMRQRVYKAAHMRVTNDVPLRDVVVTVHDCMNTDRGITIRDYNDTVRADLLFVNLLGAQKVSIGTTVEIAWAWERRIPIIVIMEDAGNPHDHPMIREMISYRLDDLDIGMKVALSILNVE